MQFVSAESLSLVSHLALDGLGRAYVGHYRGSIIPRCDELHIFAYKGQYPEIHVRVCHAEHQESEKRQKRKESLQET